MDFLRSILGSLIRVVYNLVTSIITNEPNSISYLAISIIITTIIFKILMLPLTIKQIKSQRAMQSVNPLMQEVQRKYKNNPQLMNQKLQELYKKHNYNPMSGCLPLLIQMPIIFAFFGVMREPGLYIFESAEATANIARNFFWIKNIELPDIYLWGLPLVNAGIQFIMSKLMAPAPANPDSDDPSQAMNKNMQFMMPVMMFFIARTISAGVIIYWITSNIIEILMRLALNRIYDQREEELA